MRQQSEWIVMSQFLSVGRPLGFIVDSSILSLLRAMESSSDVGMDGTHAV